MMVRSHNISVRFFAVLLLVSCVACSNKNQHPTGLTEFHRYGIEHGHIQYRFTGSLDGTSDRFWDRYGEREVEFANYRRVTEKGPQPTNGVVLYVKSDIYRVNLLNNSGTHYKDRVLDSVYHLPPSDIPDWSSFLNDEMSNLYMVSSGTDTVRGVKVDVWRQNEPHVRMDVCKGVMLRRVEEGPNGAAQSPVVFDTITPVDTMQFKVPATIHIREGKGPNG